MRDVGGPGRGAHDVSRAHTQPVQRRCRKRRLAGQSAPKLSHRRDSHPARALGVYLFARRSRRAVLGVERRVARLKGAAR